MYSTSGTHQRAACMESLEHPEEPVQHDYEAVTSLGKAERSGLLAWGADIICRLIL
jgi:hypothetical protein